MAFVPFAACGGGGVAELSAPTITSFTATPATLPPSGGEVTLSWEVVGADALSIEPLPGAVTGTSATVSVSEPTVFVLTAHNASGEALAVTEVVVTPPATVSGTVVLVDGVPASWVPVWIHGYPPTLTAEDGTFTISGVSPPYDVTTVHEGSVTAVTYLGLTTAAPTLVLLTASNEFEATSIEGTLSPGFPAPAGTFNRTCSHVVGGSGMITFAEAATGDYDISFLTWNGEPQTTVNIRAFTYLAAGNFTPPTAFVAFGSRQVTVDDGDAAIVNEDISLNPITSVGLQGTYTLPSELVFSEIYAVVAFGPTDTCSFPGATVDTGSFALTAPAISATTVAVTLDVTSPQGSTHVATLDGFSAPQSGLALELVAGGEKILPPAGANDISHDTMFTWQPFADGVHVMIVVSDNGDPSFVVFTDRDHARVPDLSEIGLELARDADYVWGVISARPFADIDEAAAGRFDPPGNFTQSVNTSPSAIRTAP
jgi:hypothetical protein